MIMMIDSDMPANAVGEMRETSPVITRRLYFAPEKTWSRKVTSPNVILHEMTVFSKARSLISLRVDGMFI